MKIIMLIEKNEQGNKEMVCMPLLFHSPGFFFPVLSFYLFSLLCVIGIFKNVKMQL